MSEYNSANDVDLNTIFTPVADVNARGVRVYYKRTSFLHWNVCGLQSKLSDRDFINYIVSFDFICLVGALWKILILVCSQIILRTVNRQLNCRSKDDSKVAYCV